MSARQSIIVLTFLIYLIGLPAFGKDPFVVSVARYDSLLVTQQFDVLLSELETDGVDSTILKKYTHLSTECEYITKYSSEELLGISQMGLNYSTLFTPFQAGSFATQYYALYRKHHDDQTYEDAVRLLKIAHSHRATYLANLSLHVKQSLEGAKKLVEAGQFPQAYDVLAPLEKGIYSIPYLSEYQEVFDMRFSRLKFIGDERTKKTFLNETRYCPIIKYEVFLKGRALLWSKKYIGAKPIYYYYSNLPENRTPYTITELNAGGGYGLGVEVNKNISSHTQLLLSYVSSTSKYLAYNGATGWITDLSFRNTEVGVGIRYSVPTEGRLRYWTSIQHTWVRMHPVAREENTTAPSDINRYYISFDKVKDTQIELNFGVALFLKSSWPITIQPYLKYIVSTQTPNDYRSNQLIGALSIGTYF